VQDHHHRSHVRRNGHAAVPDPGRTYCRPDQPAAPPTAALFVAPRRGHRGVRWSVLQPRLPRGEGACLHPSHSEIKALPHGADQITFSMRPGKAIVYMFDGAELTWHLIARGARARDGEVFWLSFDGEHKERCSARTCRPWPASSPSLL
jgi:hypothetical protein